jgi:hypothetical protein
MTFAVPNLSDTIVTQGDAIALMEGANNFLANITSQFKADWNRFWDASLTAVQMQARLDYLASLPCTDPVDAKVTNALAGFFAKARRWIAIISTENPAAFAGARKTVDGLYTEFLTPGWTYTIDPTAGRMIVTEHCPWPLPTP